MELASDFLKNYGYSFIWKIHNYSFCVLSNRHHHKEYLQSPAFELNTTRFSLLVYTKDKDSFLQDSTSNEIGFRLFINYNNNTKIQIYYEISILTTSGKFEKLGSRNINDVNLRSYSPPFDFLKCSLCKDEGGLNNYLDNDTLTVKCRIFKVNNVVLDQQICCVHTVFNVKRTIYNWNIDTGCNSNKLTFQANAKPNLFTTKNVTINACLVKEEYSERRKFEAIIRRGNIDKLSFSICTISVVEDGKIIHSKQYEHCFPKPPEEQIWRVSFIPSIYFNNHEKENCKRFLRFEFATSDLSFTTEKIEHGSNKEEVLNLVSRQSTQSDGVQSWKDNLQHFFSEGKLSDVTLRTSEKEFPVHKMMLCAQSSVFRAMFEHDTKENRTGVVEIEDLEDETVSMLLHYVYNGVFENYDWEAATNLYFAADKYEITALKEHCSILLKNNLGTSNVCKCLILADMHQDQPLKTFAQEFVLKHSSVVMKSEEWKELMKNHGTLAAETMYLSFLKNS